MYVINAEKKHGEKKCLIQLSKIWKKQEKTEICVIQRILAKDKFFKETISGLVMSKKKPIRTRGKLQLSKYFQEFVKGDNVAVVRELAIPASFPKRLQGRTGVIESKRGKAYIIKIKDQNKEKRFLIEPIHLKKIKQIK
tara:strand:- start:1988 stop:2404 length:417 start_codon:yes stop_codon:yes gene_type:complete